MKKKYYLYIFVALVVAYVALTFLLPVDPRTLERYHVTKQQVLLINTTVVIPLVAIWCAAFYGFSRIKGYAEAVRTTPEGGPFNAIAAGLLISVLGLPLSSIAAALLSRLAIIHPDLLPTTVIMRNYLGIIIAMAAFYLIGNGAQALAARTRRTHSQTHHHAWVVLLIIFSSIFTWLITASGNGKTYYLPGWLVVTTIVIPYMYIWYRGAVAAYSIYFYQQNINGALYRRALSSFSAGIAVVIGTSVFIQVLTVFTERLNRLNLTPVLGIIYLLLIMWAVGYGLIAKGAKKLKTLEDV